MRSILNQMLYWAMTLIIRVIAHKTGQGRWQFLAKYLTGTSTDVDVSEFFGQDERARLVDLAREDRYARWHQTIEYNGRGFWGRPELFYLIGCFTSNWSLAPDGSGVRFWGADVYDWHPTNEGHWHTSGLPIEDKPWLGVMFSLASKIWPEYFPVEGFPMGNPGVSNKLWADMPKAKEFTSTWDFVVPWEDLGGMTPLFMGEWDSHTEDLPLYDCPTIDAYLDDESW